MKKTKSRVKQVQPAKKEPRVPQPVNGRRKRLQTKNYNSSRVQKRSGVSYSIRTTKPPRSKIIDRFIVVGLALILLTLIGTLLYSFFLPNFFKLKENENWLFVQTNPDSPEQDRLHFVHFNQELKRIMVVMIDPNLKVSYLGPQGEYPIRAINSLLMFENNGVLNEQQLASAYSFALKEVVDRVVILPPAIDEAGNFVPEKQLDLSKRSQMKKLLLSLWREQWGEVEQRQNLLQVYFFAAGNSAWRLSNLDNQSWSSFSNQHFSKAQQNDCSLVVVNSTSESGLANKIASLLEKEGFLVTRTGNFKKELTATTIYYNDSSKECRELVERGVKPLPFVPEIINDSAITNQFRAGIVVVAGEDLI